MFKHKLKSFFGQKTLTKAQILNEFKNKKGLEIGGPSNIFKPPFALPIYTLAKSIDNVNYSNQTIWEGDIANTKFEYYENKLGKQYILEASELTYIKSDSYDFLISSHCLEHCANALKTIDEWIRVVKKGGLLLIIVPKKELTFDHRRPTTTYNHLVDDLTKNVSEDDLTHLPEIIRLHDLERDLAAGDIAMFSQRSKKNFENRGLHHHVFDIPLLEQIFKKNKLTTLYTLVDGMNLIIIGKK